MQLGRTGRGESPVDTALSSLATKPKDALLELRALYERYVDVVNAKRELDGWDRSLETGAIVEHPDGRVLPARQAEEAFRLRREELRKLEERYKSMEGDFKDGAREDLRIEIDKKKRAVRAARRAASRTKGLALDWSDLIWHELGRLEPEEWSISDAARDARPLHSAAVVCTPYDRPTLCLAFDPWRRGEPDVYEYDTWNKGEFSARLPPEFFLHHLPERRGRPRAER